MGFKDGVGDRECQEEVEGWERLWEENMLVGAKIIIIIIIIFKSGKSTF